MGIRFKRPKHPIGFPIGQTLVWGAPNDSGGTSTIVTGIAPLTLLNAKAKAINSLVQYGKVVQEETPTPSSPVDIKCNNGIIKYGLRGKNLFHGSAVMGYINTSGEEVYDDLWWASEPVYVEASTAYYFQPNSNAGSKMKHAYYTADGTFISYISSGAQGFTTPENCAYMRFSYRQTSYNVQLEVGSSPTSYEPYKGIGSYTEGTPEVIYVRDANLGGTDEQTASAEYLLEAGEYNDTQDIISGAITRNVGLKLLNGTESVSASGDGWAIAINDKLKAKAELVCTHYPYSSATMANAPDKSIIAFDSQNIGIKDSDFSSETDVQDWLAAQYAAGTPVMIIYPLLAPVTSPVTPQPLQTYAGTNSVSVVAEVEDIKFTVDYMT